MFLNMFQVQESPAPLNIPTPTPAQTEVVPDVAGYAHINAYDVPGCSRIGADKHGANITL